MVHLANHVYPPYGPKYKAKLDKRRTASVALLKNFIECADLALSLGGEVSFEWPHNCAGWLLEELLAFIARHNLFTVLVVCACE